MRSIRFRQSLDAAPDASTLLKELKVFAASRSRKSKALPSFLPSDAPAVITEKKRILDKDSSLNFSCTSCGQCCRSLPDSVLLDPHDYSLIINSNLPAASNNSSFRRVYGQFDVSVVSPNDEKNVKITHDWMIPTKTATGIAPVLFLRTSDLQNDGDSRCPFSTIAPSPSPTPSLLPKLVCSLGPSLMPYACSLYPLGDFFQSSITKKSFFSLDSQHNCEGIQKETTSTSSPVSQYVDRNNVEQRQESSEWFRRLATGHSCGGFSETLINFFTTMDNERAKQINPLWRDALPAWARTANNAKEAVESFHNKTRQIWYRHDSCKSWEETQTQITQETRALHDSINMLILQ